MIEETLARLRENNEMDAGDKARTKLELDSDLNMRLPRPEYKLPVWCSSAP